MRARTYLKFPRAALRLSPALQACLLRHIEHADDASGLTFVSCQTIADELGVKVRQVQKDRKVLIAAGVLEPAGSRRTANGLLVKRHKIVYEASSEDVSDASSQDVLGGPKRLPRTPNASSQDVLGGKKASSQDARSRDSYQEIDQESTYTETLFSPDQIPDDVTIAMQAWNQLADELDLARISHLTDGRRSKLKARLHEAGGIDGWRHALEKIRAAIWMHGTNKHGWRVTFDWIVRPEKFAQLMEGALDQHAPTADAQGRVNGRRQGSELNSAIDRIIEEADDNG